MNSKTVASNKKARFNFFLEENFVAGLLLEGWEVKSLREGKLNIKEAYVKHIKGELWLVGARIDPAKYINQKDQVNPERFRKLLLNQREVEKILFAISAKGPDPRYIAIKKSLIYPRTLLNKTNRLNVLVDLMRFINHISLKFTLIVYLI